VLWGRNLSNKKEILGTWVHVFEQDSADGAVFRPEDGDIPLSRRPRERVELCADGSAVLMMAGEDDRYVPQPAHWQEESGAVVVRDNRGAVRMRVIAHAPDRLVVRLRGD
jgi:hypothetical protein